MLRVLLHDLRSSALFLGPVVLLGSVGALSMARFGPAFFWWITLLAAAMALVTPTVEWRTGTSTFLHSLPVSRGQVVAGRFLGGGLAIVAGCVLSVAMAVSLAAAVTALGRPWPAWVDVDVLLAFVIVAACVVGPALACVFAFELGPGATVASVYTIVLAAVVEVPVVFRVGGPGSADPASRPAGGIVRMAVSASVDRIGLASTAMTAIAFAILVLWVSARVSCRVRRRQEF